MKMSGDLIRNTRVEIKINEKVNAKRKSSCTCNERTVFVVTILVMRIAPSVTTCPVFQCCCCEENWQQKINR